MPVLAVEQNRRTGGQRGVGDDGRRGALDGDRGGAAAVGDRDHDLVGALFRQREGRGVDGVLGRVAVLGDAGARGPKRRACRSSCRCRWWPSSRRSDRRRPASMKVAIGAAAMGDALGADDREGGDGQRALGHGGGGRSAGGRAGRAEGDRDRYAVDRSGVGAAGEGDRVGDGVGAVFVEGVRAGDVVDAGVAGVLGDGAGVGVGRRVAPVDRGGEVAGGEARRAREGRRSAR